jgi:signal transduction histidine kinase
MAYMSVEKSQYNSGHPIGKTDKEKPLNTWEFYCKIIENSDGIPFQLIFGPRPGEGYYLHFGNGIIQLLGIAPEDFTEELIQGMIENIVPLSEEIPSDISEARRKFISGEIKRYRAEILVRTADKKKWVHVSSLPLTDQDSGKVTGATGIIYDITENKRNVDTLNKLKEIAEAEDRLKAAFLRNISHEIRTPLNAIVGYSALLSEQLESPEPHKEYLDIILRSSDQLLKIIDDLMEISKIEAKTVKITLDKVNLNSIIRMINDQFWNEASGKDLLLSYKTGLTDKESDVFTDRYKVTQVLWHLISNAVKFTEAGSVDFGYSMKDGKVEFWVSDTGPGIPEEQQAVVFSRFRQGDNTPTRSHGGIGLGLAISRGYVELLGGEIWFTSKPGEGSVFRFMIPAEKLDSD